MHTLINFLPLAVMLALTLAEYRWSKRPSVRAKWAALSLREKIARTIRIRQNTAAFQAGWLAMNTGLYLAGWQTFSGWLAVTIVIVVNMPCNLWLLRNALITRRAYDKLGPLAYLAEIRHTFGTGSTPAQTPDVTANNLAVLRGRDS
jgi:hypothetical protein